MARYIPLLAAVALITTAILLWLAQRSSPAPAEAVLASNETAAGEDSAAITTQTMQAPPQQHAAQAGEPGSATASNKPTQPTPPTAPANSITASKKRAAPEPLSDAELSALLQRRLTPAMRDEINQQLQPGKQAPQLRQGRYGSYLDMSDRASSVVIAVIDDDGSTVVTDITAPLPENDQ
ncbi:MAG: hypothetical protein KJP25_07735 [Gammaproteobacteria bacterium]|nr:hypothetical protein [Gammaproteobacteria bacterium]NND40390.1 hypothetical protein [Pseudomonadales bacterium]MBT8149845.1 hypothetical protein [Gammaproteobacteria bacterium]NNL11545.1 hypothetical protein [Pseudomonadales bacterium]NNM12547.1 hypothetical protein [Pseudomonadales bacterium]